MDVVDAREEHLSGMAEIYAAAAETPATFDLEGHPAAWWRARSQLSTPPRAAC